MKRAWTVTLVFALVIAGFWAFWGSRSNDSGEVDARLSAVMALQDAQGKKLTLSDLRGHPVLVHFWATWCPPCLDELGEWVKFVKKNEAKGLIGISVSLDKSWADAQKLLPEKDLSPNLRSFLDPAMKSSEEFGSYQFPESYLFDKNLKLAHKFVGGQYWDRPEVAAFVLKAGE